MSASFNPGARFRRMNLIFPWPGSGVAEPGPRAAEQEERVEAWAWTLGYALLAGVERLFALAARDFEVLFEGMRNRLGPDGGSVREGILTFADPNLGGSGYLERFAAQLPAVATAALHHLDHEGCESACYRCLKSYDNQRHHDRLKWPLVTSTLEGLREDTPQPLALDASDVNDPRPWREAFEAGVGSPLEYRCWMLMQAAGLAPLKQFPIVDPTMGRRITIADFAFPDRQVAIYVDGMSIHLGEVLRRDRQIEARLQNLDPPWTVLRLSRREIDHDPQGTIERLRSVLPP